MVEVQSDYPVSRLLNILKVSGSDRAAAFADDVTRIQVGVANHPIAGKHPLTADQLVLLKAGVGLVRHAGADRASALYYLSSASTVAGNLSQAALANDPGKTGSVLALPFYALAVDELVGEERHRTVADLTGRVVNAYGLRPSLLPTLYGPAGHLDRREAERGYRESLAMVDQIDPTQIGARLAHAHIAARRAALLILLDTYSEVPFTVAELTKLPVDQRAAFLDFAGKLDQYQQRMAVYVENLQVLAATGPDAKALKDLKTDQEDKLTTAKIGLLASVQTLFPSGYATVTPLLLRTEIQKLGK